MTELNHDRRHARAGGGSIAGVRGGDSRLGHGRVGLSRTHGGVGPSWSRGGAGLSHERGVPGSVTLVQSDRGWSVQVMDRSITLGDE
jgi:hypothetical protein